MRRVLIVVIAALALATPGLRVRASQSAQRHVSRVAGVIRDAHCGSAVHCQVLDHRHVQERLVSRPGVDAEAREQRAHLVDVDGRNEYDRRPLADFRRLRFSRRGSDLVRRPVTEAPSKVASALL